MCVAVQLLECECWSVYVGVCVAVYVLCVYWGVCVAVCVAVRLLECECWSVCWCVCCSECACCSVGESVLKRVCSALGDGAARVYLYRSLLHVFVSLFYMYS